MARYELIMKNDCYYLKDIGKECLESVRYHSAQTKLLEYYYSDIKTSKITSILKRIEDDKYFPILSLIYEERMIIEDVAYEMGVDVRTILRNKKRLTLLIYDLLEDMVENE